jgi:hypothetical protein
MSAQELAERLVETAKTQAAYGMEGGLLIEAAQTISDLLEALDMTTTVLRSMAEHAKANGHVIESMYAMNTANMYGKPEG